MQKITTAVMLREAIVQLEKEHAEEGKLLKQQFHIVYESIKPLNLIKSTMKAAIGSPELKANLVDTSVGLAAGYLSRLLFVNVSHSRIRKVLGIALQFGITKLVTQYPDQVKNFGTGLFSVLKHSFKKRIPAPGNDHSCEPPSRRLFTKCE